MYALATNALMAALPFHGASIWILLAIAIPFLIVIGAIWYVSRM